MEVAVKVVERRSSLHLASRGKRSSTRRAPGSLRKVILLIVADSFYSAAILSPRGALFVSRSTRVTERRTLGEFSPSLMRPRSETGFLK